MRSSNKVCFLCLIVVSFLAGLSHFLISAEPAPPAIKLTPVKMPDFQQWVKQQTGHITIVDCWATYCAPCKQDFHNLVELSKQYPASKLQTASLCFEFDADQTFEKQSAPIIKFLAEQQATQSHHMILATDSDEFAEELKIDGVPTILIYGKQGELLKKFDGKFTYDEVKEYLGMLLK
jgi:thiol-disulfide isomerase/thioredoxin